jgi:hypothetical protein
LKDKFFEKDRSSIESATTLKIIEDIFPQLRNCENIMEIPSLFKLSLNVYVETPPSKFTSHIQILFKQEIIQKECGNRVSDVLQVESRLPCNNFGNFPKNSLKNMIDDKHIIYYFMMSFVGYVKNKIYLENGWIPGLLIYYVPDFFTHLLYTPSYKAFGGVSYTYNKLLI